MTTHLLKLFILPSNTGFEVQNRMKQVSQRSQLLCKLGVPQLILYHNTYLLCKTYLNWIVNLELDFSVLSSTCWPPSNKNLSVCILKEVHVYLLHKGVDRRLESKLVVVEAIRVVFLYPLRVVVLCAVAFSLHLLVP